MCFVLAVLVVCQQPYCPEEDITEPRGELTSPGFAEGQYPNDYTCMPMFVVPDGYVLLLEFHTMALENSYQCYKDVIMIITPEETIYELCGTYTPPKIIIREKFFGLAFVTDSDGTDKGFNLTYTQIEKALTCDETRYTKFGAVSAPVDMEGNYKDDIDCTWTIISRYDGGMITVKVTEMDIISPNIGTCEQDYLQISDNLGYNLGKFCGNLSLPILQIMARAVYLNFHSDEAVSGRGFMAFYGMRDERQICGSVLAHPTGTVELVDYYEHLTSCYWLLLAPKGSLIKLKFLLFKLYNTPNCTREYLLIKDYFGSESKRLCDFDLPPPYTSSTNALLVTYFVSEIYYTVWNKFQIQYRHVSDRLSAVDPYFSGSDGDVITTLRDDSIQPTPGRPTMFYEFGPTTDIFHQSTGIGQKSKQAIPYECTEKPLTHSDKPYTKSGKPYTKSDKPITRNDKLYKPGTSTFTHSDKPYRQRISESLGNGTTGTPSAGERTVSERKDETSQYRVSSDQNRTDQLCVDNEHSPVYCEPPSQCCFHAFCCSLSAKMLAGVILGGTTGMCVVTLCLWRCLKKREILCGKKSAMDT